MKTLAELKKAIQNKNVEDSLIVLVYKDTPFIAYQYAEAIAEFKNLRLTVSEDFDSKFLDFENSMFDFSDIDCLRLFLVDKFTTKLTKELSTIKNAIVICKDVEDSTLKLLKDIEAYFEIPKLQDWQIVDYMSVRCPGLSEAKIKWLCNISGKDIYRLNNEMNKISCFNKKEQDDVFDMIDADDGYNDLTQNTIFNLTNAICARDYKEISSILKDIANMDVEPVGLITMLRRNFKLILNIQLDSTATAEKLKIKSTQFNIIKSKNCRKFTDARLREIYDFLVTFDYKLKSGELDISKERLLDYILCEVLS